VLGTDEFISTIPAARCKQQGLLTLEQLATLVSADYGISASALRSPSRARHLAKLRVVFAQQAIERGIATVSAIATFLNRDPSSLTKLLARHDAKI
jgi:chromosomal replication initiation ATPase DnaA